MANKRRLKAPTIDRAQLSDGVAPTLIWVRVRDMFQLRWGDNPKKHNIDGVKAALREHGFKNIPIFDPNIGVQAGNGRVEALFQMEQDAEALPRGILTDTDGAWVMPLVTGVDSSSVAAARAYAIDDNNLMLPAGFRADQKAAIWNVEDYTRLMKLAVDEGEEMPVTVSEGDVRELLRHLEEDKEEKKLDGNDRLWGEDKAAALRDKWKVERGQLWQLGELHYIYCGDSFDPETWQVLLAGQKARVAVTDPPYAIYGSSSGLSAEITDDAMVQPFFLQLFKMLEENLDWFGHAYVCCDWRSWAAIWQMAKQTRMVCKNKIVWDKGAQGMGNNYANCYEEIGFFHKLPKQNAMGDRPTGQRAVLRPNLQRFNRVPGPKKAHNAQKPLALMTEFILNSSDKGDLVLEPFCGSGTTVMACQMEGRRCRAVDLDPKWVAVTLERFKEEFGIKAVKVEHVLEESEPVPVEA